MKNKYQISAVLLSLVLLFTASTSLNAQKMFRKLPAVKAFHRGSFLVGISEGTTTAVYTTKQRSETFGTPNLVKRGLNEGCRDPLFIEYGISNHWGLGLSSGKDIFSISPSDYYGFTTNNNTPIKISTGEFTFDAAYHVFANKRLDLSVFNSIGCFSVAFQGQDGDANPYKYTANGKIWRFGSKVRYYFFRHLGAVGMISYYAAHASPKNVKDNTVATNYNTNISGYAIEIGLCYRFFR
jgi:hypothetical protein